MASSGDGATFLWMFQDFDELKSVRMMSTDPTDYITANIGRPRALVTIDSIWDGTMVDTVSKQLNQLALSLRGAQGTEMYIKLIFRSRT